MLTYLHHHHPQGIDPFYYAIYDHDLYRFIELQYRHGKDSPLFSIRIPDSMQPPVTSGPGVLLKK
ncbi:MAG: hypothetical protein IPI95_04180 [Flavobacteriales bacterium]|nr:hypothetical protein [Flavobacteriales bacterium]